MGEERERAVMSPELLPLDPTILGEKAEALKAKLESRIVGQQEAIQEVVSALTVYWSGLATPNRPIVCLLFAGSTGVGKTELCRVLAEYVLGDAKRLTLIACSEYTNTQRHFISKLVGSPPSYVGASVEPLLGTDTLNKWREKSERQGVNTHIVCFDEVEKSCEELHMLLLGILDSGTLTCGDNSVTDFTKSIIIMTTNMGARDAAALTEKGVLGFSVTETGSADTEKIILAAGKALFSPEFLNRLDKTVVFKPLTRESVKRILCIELGKFQKRVIASSAEKFLISITPEAREELLNIGFSEKFGGREIRRTVDVHIAQPIARLLASGQLEHGDVLFVGFDTDSSFTFCKEVQQVKTDAPVQIDFEIVTIPVQSEPGPRQGMSFDEWFASLPEASIKESESIQDCPDGSCDLS